MYLFCMFLIVTTYFMLFFFYSLPHSTFGREQGKISFFCNPFLYIY